MTNFDFLLSDPQFTAFGEMLVTAGKYIIQSIW